jgi:hypothetical protein
MTRRLIAAALVAALLVPGTANAGGILADTFVRPFSPHAADELDKAHENLGSRWTMPPTLLPVLPLTRSCRAPARS